MCELDYIVLEGYKGSKVKDYGNKYKIFLTTEIYSCET